MYGYENLKSSLTVTKDSVECPVVGCDQMVRRRRRGDANSPDFICPDHNLDISPSTFAYATEEENMLWKDQSDMKLFNDIKRVKRESRINANNSEDAVTWNVFRYLERAGLLSDVAKHLCGITLVSPRIIYWSWAQDSRDQDTNGDWTGLNQARNTFGELSGRSSEPDIILLGDNGLVFIEAKLTSGNNTEPSRKTVETGYTNGEGRWFEKVFSDDFQSIAVSARKYELLRFWLLGTWLANTMDIEFHLLNLVPANKEWDIVEEFGIFIHQNKEAKFSRITWEDIWRFIALGVPDTPDRQRILGYFTDRTIGYQNGRLRRAFNPALGSQ